MAEHEHSVVTGALIILALSALLFWLPVIGPGIAGYIGGRRAGSLTGGAVAGLLPAVAVGLLTTFVVNALPNISAIIAALVGGVAALWVAGNMLAAIIAAAVGGYQEEHGAPA